MKKYNLNKNLIYEMHNSQRLDIINDLKAGKIDECRAEEKMNKIKTVFLEKRKRNEDIFLKKLLKKSIDKLTRQEVAKVKEIEIIRDEIILIY